MKWETYMINKLEIMNKSKKVWIVSDTHFNHKAIKKDFEFRKLNFEYEICRKIKNNVKEWDVLIHLWDIIFDRKSELKKYLDLMWPCTKILVKWNHDTASNEFYYNKGFDFVTDEIKIWNVILTHKPKMWSELKEWEINVHWHNHTNREHILYYADTSEQYVLYDTIENNYMPVLLNQLIKKWLKEPILTKKKTLWQIMWQIISEFIEPRKRLWKWILLNK